MDVIIVTNAVHEDELGLLKRLCRETLSKNGGAVRSYGDLTDPWDLTWCHKAIIAREFLQENHGRYTHFIYLENDIRLSFLNFCYFVEFREALRGFGLVPSFIRVEYSTAFGGFTSSDVFWPVYVPVQPHVLLGDIVLANMPNPYNPMFILDLELGAEYVQSPSFDRQASGTVCPWGVAERAAMGLCLENVPAPFQCRYVVPICQKTDAVPAFAWVWHMPNNYAGNPHSPLGKVRMDQMFVGAGELGQDGRWSMTNPVGATTGDREDGSLPTADEFAQRYHVRVSGGADIDAIDTDASLVVEDVPAFRDQYYLITHHDTVVFADTDLRLVRHAPFGIAPWNLVIELTDQKGRLLMRGKSPGEVRQLWAGRSDSDINAQMGRANLDCDIENFSDGSIGIRAGDNYLGSDLDGVVYRKSWCRDWERYLLVRADTIEGLALLRRYSWLSHTDRQLRSLAAQPIDFGRERPAESSALAASCAPGTAAFRRKIAFGPTSLKLIERRPQFVFEPCNPALGQIIPERLRIFDSGTETQSDFSLFRPLVHFSLGNEDSQLEKLRHSLDSLSRQTGLAATISIASAQPNAHLRQQIPEPYRSDALFLNLGSTYDDMTGALEGIFDYHPVVLANAGCSFGTDLEENLIRLLLLRKGELALGPGMAAYATAPNLPA
ncbi:hypothetical protein [Mesorhizobium sangaii]|uniref:Uncharacterized protein n=1 Tax=Mesorhizobium sangaii TaxID=505389 RepID=A0A841PFN2_9HYPH|nr:hypothetical protein [Mesorhizobium sangaii]MBB6408749.1 hypothetical protein [Mesorhizobium sangaii]